MFRIYVTDMTAAQQVLVNKGYEVTIGTSFLVVKALEVDRMNIIVLLNQCNIVVYDIERLEEVT